MRNVCVFVWRHREYIKMRFACTAAAAPAAAHKVTGNGNTTGRIERTKKKSLRTNIVQCPPTPRYLPQHLYTVCTHLLLHKFTLWRIAFTERSCSNVYASRYKYAVCVWYGSMPFCVHTQTMLLIMYDNTVRRTNGAQIAPSTNRRTARPHPHVASAFLFCYYPSLCSRMKIDRTLSAYSATHTTCELIRRHFYLKLFRSLVGTSFFKLFLSYHYCRWHLCNITRQNIH